MALYITLND